MKLLVFLLFTERIVFIFGQLLEISNSSIEQGDMFTVSCSVATINKAITFKVENEAVGSCSPPFGTLVTCDNPDIQQNLSSGITSWTISSAQVSHNGYWTCSLDVVPSPQVQLIIYKLPTTVLTSSGIISNAVVNNTVSYTVNIEVGCLFSGNGPRINLQFMKATIPKATILMTCTNSSTVCSTCTGCSAYDCNHNITLDDLKSGDIDKNVEYTLQTEVGVLGTTNSYTSPLFPGFTVTFISPNSQTNTVLPTERITTTTNYINEYNNTYVTLTSENVTPSNVISETVTPSNFISETLTTRNFISETVTPSNFISDTAISSNFISGTVIPSNFISETVTPSNFISGTLTPSNFISETVTPSNFISNTATPSNFISEVTTPTSLGKVSTLVFDAEISKSALVSMSIANSSEMTDITLSHVTRILFTSTDLLTWFSSNSATTSFPMSNLFLSSFDSFSSQTHSFFSQTFLKTSFLEISDITSNTFFSITGVLSDSSSAITKLPIVLLTSISTPSFKIYSTPLSTFAVAISTNALLGSTHENTDDLVEIISVLTYQTTTTYVLTSYTLNSGIVSESEITNTNTKSYLNRSETYLTNDQNAISDSVRNATNIYVSSEFHSQILRTTQPIISIDTLVYATDNGDVDSTSCSRVSQAYTSASIASIFPKLSYSSEISKLSTISLPVMTLLESSIYPSSIEDDIMTTELQNSGFLSSISVNMSRSIGTSISMKTSKLLVPTATQIVMSGYLQSSFYPTDQDFSLRITEYFVTAMQPTISFLVSSTEKNPLNVNSKMRTTASGTKSSVYPKHIPDMLTVHNNTLMRTIVDQSDLRTTLFTSTSAFEHQLNSSMSNNSFSRTIDVTSIITAQSTIRKSFSSLIYSSDSYMNVVLSTSTPFLYATSTADFKSTTIHSTSNTIAGISETTKSAIFITIVSVVVIIIILFSSIMLLSRVTFERKTVNVSLSNEGQFPYMKRAIYPRFSDSLSSYMTSPYERNWHEV